MERLDKERWFDGNGNHFYSYCDGSGRKVLAIERKIDGKIYVFEHVLSDCVLGVTESVETLLRKKIDICLIRRGHSPSGLV